MLRHLQTGHKVSGDSNHLVPDVSPPFSQCAGSTRVSASFFLGTEAAQSVSLTSLKRDTASPELPTGAFAPPYTGSCQREVGLATGWADGSTDATGLAVERSCCHRSA